MALVVAARRTTQQRLTELPDQAQVSSSELADERQLRDQLDRWQGREDELSGELENIHERAAIHAQLGSPLGVDPKTANGVIARDPVGERLTRVLGPLPQDPEAKDIWLAAYERVSDYREVWNVDDERTPPRGDARLRRTAA